MIYVLQPFLFGFLFISVLSSKIFKVNQLNQWKLGKKVMVIDMCEDCDFEHEIQELYQSSMSVFHLNHPHSLQYLATHSIYRLVTIVTDSANNTMVRVDWKIFFKQPINNPYQLPYLRHLGNYCRPRLTSRTLPRY